MANIQVYIVGANGQEVAVNAAGELIVSSGPYDLTVFQDMDTINTAYNFYGPKGLQQFVITGFLALGDKDISDASDSTVVIYESDAPDSTTASRVVIQFEIAKLIPVPFPNIKILCNHGVYINAKTADDDVHMTIFGHYVDLDGKGETQ